VVPSFLQNLLQFPTISCVPFFRYLLLPVLNRRMPVVFVTLTPLFGFVISAGFPSLRRALALICFLILPFFSPFDVWNLPRSPPPLDFPSDPSSHFSSYPGGLGFFPQSQFCRDDWTSGGRSNISFGCNVFAADGCPPFSVGRLLISRFGWRIVHPPF